MRDGQFRSAEDRWKGIQAHLSGIDLLSAEGVFVGPHVGDGLSCLSMGGFKWSLSAMPFRHRGR